MNLEFDAQTHTYRLDDRILPSVTQVIRAVIPGWEASEWHMQRGTALHHGCRLLDQGVLDWNTVSPEIRSGIEAWRTFLADSGCEVLELEKQMASARYQFAGMCDRIIRVTGRRVVCEIKSTLYPTFSLQLGGYALLDDEQDKLDMATEAVAVEVGTGLGNGTYRTLWLSPHELRRAKQEFLACLTVYGFMQEQGVLS